MRIIIIDYEIIIFYFTLNQQSVVSIKIHLVKSIQRKSLVKIVKKWQFEIPLMFLYVFLT